MKNKGFTLAELLIVVAIIGVLAAVSIPILFNQMEKSREAADAANIRSQYTQVMSEAILTGNNVNADGTTFGKIDLQQKEDGWKYSSFEESLNNLGEVEGTIRQPQANGTAWVEYKDEKLTVHYGTGNGGAAAVNPADLLTKEFAESIIEPIINSGNFNSSKQPMSSKDSELMALLKEKLSSNEITVQKYYNSAPGSGGWPKTLIITTDGDFGFYDLDKGEQKLVSATKYTIESDGTISSCEKGTANVTRTNNNASAGVKFINFTQTP